MKKITLRLEEAQSLYHALGALDGFQKMSDKGVPALVPYKFSDETRRLIVKNRRALKPVIEEITEQRADIVKALTCSDENPEGTGFISEDNDPASAGMFQVKMRGVLKEKRTFEVHHIDESALLCENKNPIPGSILELLAPITDEATVAAEEAKPVGGDEP